MADRHFSFRRALLLLVLMAASCSRSISASEARRQADEYIRAQFNVRDVRPLKVDTTENATAWVVTYSAKGEAIGGPLVIAVDKKTGRARLIEGHQ